MTVTINSLELENVKRVKAVKLEPAATGLTVIGGNNNNGKTSVLDAIAWALGGDKKKPSKAQREGSMVDPYIHITLSNGLEVERKGAKSALKVSDPLGRKGGQKLLDSFISQFALDLPKFMEQTGKQKADTLLQIIGVGSELDRLDREYSNTYSDRTSIGRIRDQKQKYADEMRQWDGVPEEPVSATELIQRQQKILANNGMRARYMAEADRYKAQMTANTAEIGNLQRQINYLLAQNDELTGKLNAASASASEIQEESTAEIETSIANIDSINAKVRDNLEKAKAMEEAKQYADKYDEYTQHLAEIKEQRMNLLNGADLPLPDLTVQNGELMYKGQAWDNMSGSEQLIVSTAIVRKLNPECGFVLVDKLEQMDLNTLNDFGEWLKKEGLQAIATRVSTGDECSIFIEDGYSVDHIGGTKTAETEVKPATMWKAGSF